MHHPRMPYKLSEEQKQKLEDSLNSMQSLLGSLVEDSTGISTPPPVTPSPPPSASAPYLNFQITGPTAPLVALYPVKPAGGYISAPGRYRVSADLARISIACDDVLLDLNGHAVSEITLGETVAVHRVAVSMGSVGRVWCGALGNTDLELYSVDMTNSISLEGSRVLIQDVRVAAVDFNYAIFMGRTTGGGDVQIRNCTFSSAGPNALVRICNSQRVLISECNFNEPMYHHLRFHGYQQVMRDIYVANCVFNGTGNGIGLAFESSQVEPFGTDNATFYRCNMTVGGFDKFNADRNGGGARAKNTRVIECTGGPWT